MSIKKISLISLFIALSVAGASIKIPAIVSSVALDMVPALLAGVMFGWRTWCAYCVYWPFIIGFYWWHAIRSISLVDCRLEMALLVWLFAIVYKKGMRVASKYSICRWEHVCCSIPFLFIMGMWLLSRDASVFVHWSSIQYSDCAYFSTTFDSFL